jgi:uncharacterized protein YecT (DUF1311 family)
MKKSAIGLLTLSLIASSSVAQDDESKCCCTTYDVSVCLGKIRKKADADLNRAYEDALGGLKDSPTDIGNLKNAERKWVEYRDAACKAEYGLWGGGSGGPNAFAECVIRITRVRTSDLKNAYLNTGRTANR